MDLLPEFSNDTDQPSVQVPKAFFFSSLSLSSLELSYTQVYEPYTRALLGTASPFCEVVVLKLRTVPTQAHHPSLLLFLAHKKGWISTPCLSSRTSIWCMCLRPTTVHVLCVCCFFWHSPCALPCSFLLVLPWCTVWCGKPACRRPTTVGCLFAVFPRATGPQLLNVYLLFFLEALETSGLISSPNYPSSANKDSTVVGLWHAGFPHQVVHHDRTKR